MSLTAPDTISLRGHHLFCIHFLHGSGYSADFARHALRIKSGISTGRFEVVEGRDDLCDYCPMHADEHDSCMQCWDGHKAAVGLDRVALQLLGLEVGDTISGTELEERMVEALSEWRTRACTSCSSEETCALVMDLMVRS